MSDLERDFPGAVDGDPDPDPPLPGDPDPITRRPVQDRRAAAGLDRGPHPPDDAAALVGRLRAELAQAHAQRDVLRQVISLRSEHVVGAFIDGLAAFLNGARAGEEEASATLIRLTDLLDQAVKHSTQRVTSILVPKGTRRAD